MSRNRSETRCQCVFWYFEYEQTLSPDDAGLMTPAEYAEKIGIRPEYRRDCGYGYRDDLHGHKSWKYRIPGNAYLNDGWTNSRDLIPRDAIVVTEYEIQPVPPDERYRMRHLQCPLCFAQYVGWYRAFPPETAKSAEGTITRRPVTYELYDTSFWLAFNDEPCPEDGPQRPITSAVVRDALMAWFAAH